MLAYHRYNLVQEQAFFRTPAASIEEATPKCLQGFPLLEKATLMSKKTKYESDIELGKKYREPRSGIEGTAVAVHFFEHACERVTIETFNEAKGEIVEYSFDAPRLTSVETGEPATTAKPGGPARQTGRGLRG